MSKTDEKSILAKLVDFEIKLARDGSTKDAVDLLKRALTYLEKEEPMPEPLKNYFNLALRSITNGVDPNRAFLLIGKQGSDKDGVHKRYEIARLYRTYKNRGYLTDKIIEEMKLLGHEIGLRRAQDIHREFKEILNIEEEIGSLPPRQKRTKK